MWEPQGNHRVQIRYGGTVSVPPGTTLCNMAQCAGLKTPTIVIITPPTTNQPPHRTLPGNQQQQPPLLVPPKVWGDSSDTSKPCRNVTTLSARRVGDLARMFGTKTDEKTTPIPGRWPATKKTTRKTTRTDEDDRGTPQCVPKVVKKSFTNISDNLDKKDVLFSDFGRQPPVVFVSLPNSNMHEPLPDDVPAVQMSRKAIL